MNFFKQWMRAATSDEQEQMAAAIGTSRGMLYQISNEHASVSPERAAAIEQQTWAMYLATNGRLPAVYRSDLNPACRQCEFARKCLGKVVDRVPATVPVADESEGGTHD